MQGEACVCSVTHVHIGCQQTLHLHIKCIGCGKTLYKFVQGVRFLFYLLSIGLSLTKFMYILSVYVQPIAFGVSFLQSRISIDNLVL